MDIGNKFSMKNLQEYAFLSVISLTMFCVQVLSVKVASSLFGLDYKFILISLAATGAGLGGCLFLLRDKLGYSRRWFTVIYYASLLGLLLYPYTTTAVINDLFGVWAYFGLLFVVYFMGGVLLTEVLFRNIQQFAYYYAIHLIVFALGLALVVWLIPVGYAAVVFVILGLNAFLVIVAFCNSIKHITLATIVTMVVAVLIGSNILGNSFYATIPCVFDKNFAGITPIDGRDSFFSQAQLYENNERYTVLYGCVRVTSLYKNKNQEWYDSRLEWSMPFQFSELNNTLIIGSGAGAEIQNALAMDAGHVVGVEINAGTIDLISTYVDPEQNPYNDERATLVVADGRRTAADLDEKFDLVFLPKSGRFGVFGINSLSTVPNYLFTKEAMATYLDALEDQGVLAFISRGYTTRFETESLLAALKEKGGYENTKNEVVYIQGVLNPLDEIHFNNIENKTEAEGLQKSIVVLVMHKNGGFSDEEIQFIEERVVLEGNYSTETISLNEYQIDKNLVMTDNRPYYTQKEAFAGDYVFEYIRSDKQKELVAEVIAPSVFRSYAQLAIIPFLLTFGIAVYYWRRELLVKTDVKALTLMVFVPIGMGYMFLQLGYMNLFYLVYESPILSFSILLCIFIILSGVGSLVASLQLAVLSRYQHLFVIAAAVVAGMTVVYAEQIRDFAVNQDSVVGATVLLIGVISAPALMAGYLFPYAIELVSKKEETSAALMMYLLDAFITVLAGIAALLISVTAGYGVLLFVGAACYIVASVCVCLLVKRIG